MKNKYSLIAYFIGAFILCYTSLVYYPKWKVGEGELALTWDVSGYYFYLPAIFIYKDLKEIKFKDKIMKQYRPTPELQQAFKDKESGNYVMKYSCGQALNYLPAFLVAHSYAKVFNREADGFSKPYQFSIIAWTLLMGLLGLWFTRKNLLHFFDDSTSAISLLLLVIGTNYLNYTSIDSAMTHNWCFVLLAILIYSTIRFYETAAWKFAIAIGICVGWAALTRPTEILISLIPLAWGIHNKNSLNERFAFWQKQFPKLFASIFFTIILGSIQLFYWKYVTGHWIVYSYEDQGFSWLEPHLQKGLFSYRAGWLTYSPMMYFALLGFILLFQKHKNIALTCFIYTILFIYIAFAWDIWWYGGSLGQRTMVQSYALQIIPLAAFVAWFLSLFQAKNFFKKRVMPFAIIVAMCFFAYVNLWFTHQAHRGGFFAAGEMTKKFYWTVLLHWNLKDDYKKTLDIDEYFFGSPKNLQTVYFNDFNTDSLAVIDNDNLNNKLLFMDEWNQFSKKYVVKNPNSSSKWLRLSSDFRFTQGEWDTWKMLQMQIAFVKDGKKIKEKSIRVHRFYDNSKSRNIAFDVLNPTQNYDFIEMSYWNGQSKTTTYIDNLKLESFD